MNSSAWIVPLLTGLVGWLLNEVSHRWREIAADKRAISRALADLLEIRHQTVGVKHFLDEFMKRFKLPPNVLPAVLPLVERFLPKSVDLSNRYNDAVDAVASSDPFLGFYLRSKDQVTPLLNTLRQLMSTDVNAMAIWPQFQATLIDAVKSPLDDAILELAKQHSRRTAKRARKYLAEPSTLPAELTEYFAKIEPLISAASQQAEATTRSGA